VLFGSNSNKNIYLHVDVDIFVAIKTPSYCAVSSPFRLILEAKSYLCLVWDSY